MATCKYYKKFTYHNSEITGRLFYFSCKNKYKQVHKITSKVDSHTYVIKVSGFPNGLYPTIQSVFGVYDRTLANLNTTDVVCYELFNPISVSYAMCFDILHNANCDFSMIGFKDTKYILTTKTLDLWYIPTALKSHTTFNSNFYPNYTTQIEVQFEKTKIASELKNEQIYYLFMYKDTHPQIHKDYIKKVIVETFMNPAENVLPSDYIEPRPISQKKVIKNLPLGKCFINIDPVVIDAKKQQCNPLKRKLSHN